MIELSTPKELIEESIKVIEDERKYQKIKQKELALRSGIPFPTYKEFIYKQKISLENLFKLFIALGMFDNIKGLLRKREFQTLEDIKTQNSLPKRINS